MNFEKVVFWLKKIVSIIAVIFLFVLAIKIIQFSVANQFGDKIRYVLDKNINDIKKSTIISLLISIIIMTGSPISALSISFSSIDLVDNNIASYIIYGSRLAPLLVLLLPYLRSISKDENAIKTSHIVITDMFFRFVIFLFIIPINYFLNKFQYIDYISNFFSYVLPKDTWFDSLLSYLVSILHVIFSNIILFFIGFFLIIFAIKSFDKVFTFSDAVNIEDIDDYSFFKKVFLNIKNFWIKRIYLKESFQDKFLNSLQSKSLAFFSGITLTFFTMSSTASIAILIPFYLKKVIKFNSVVAFVIGTNISTLVDTFFLSIVTNNNETIKMMTVVLLSTIISTFISFIFIYFDKLLNILFLFVDFVSNNKKRFYTFWMLFVITLFSLFVVF